MFATFRRPALIALSALALSACATAPYAGPTEVTRFSAPDLAEAPRGRPTRGGAGAAGTGAGLGGAFFTGFRSGSSNLTFFSFLITGIETADVLACSLRCSG